MALSLSLSQSTGDVAWLRLACRRVPPETAAVGGGYSFIGDDARRMKEEKDEDEEEVMFPDVKPSNSLSMGKGGGRGGPSRLLARLNGDEE